MRAENSNFPPFPRATTASRFPSLVLLRQPRNRFVPGLSSASRIKTGCGDSGGDQRTSGRTESPAKTQSASASAPGEAAKSGLPALLRQTPEPCFRKIKIRPQRITAHPRLRAEGLEAAMVWRQQGEYATDNRADPAVRPRRRAAHVPASGPEWPESEQRRHTRKKNKNPPGAGDSLGKRPPPMRFR